MDLFQVTEKSLQELKSKGAQKALVQANLTTAKEFNLEANKMTLLRTTFDQNLSMKSILDQKQASSSGNQFFSEAIQALAEQSVSAAKATPPDEAYGFAPGEGKKSFHYGDQEANDEWMYSQLDNLLQETMQKYPKTILEGAIVKFVKSETVLATSEGSLFDQNQGFYEGYAMFTTKDGKKSSSFNYTGFQMSSKDIASGRSLLQTSGLEELIRQSSEQVNVKKIPGKFEGDIIITPHCMEGMIHSWLTYLSSGALLKKNSFLQNKKGQKVGSDLWNLTTNPRGEQYASQSYWTGDGYLTEKESIFENGVLKNYLLGHYAAQKLGERVSRTSGGYLQLGAGQTPMSDLITQVKEGILLARFSGGYPAENGDFSGVAKNSYYIKDGKIQYPVTETMISGNLAKMLFDLQGVSKETINMGSGIFPWTRFTGITVS